MKSVLNVRSEIINLVKARRAYLRSFRRAANDREAHNNKKHLRQFKTEKWLQAQLVHHFRSKRIYVIPEYSTEKWDLCIPNGESDFLLMLKCLADSGQHPSSDFRGVRKDLKAIGNSNSRQVALVLILPLDANDKRRTNYTKKMLEYIEQYDTHKILIMKKDKILFAPNGNEGIWVVWIEPK